MVKPPSMQERSTGSVKSSSLEQEASCSKKCEELKHYKGLKQAAPPALPQLKYFVLCFSPRSCFCLGNLLYNVARYVPAHSFFLVLARNGFQSIVFKSFLGYLWIK